MPAALAFARLVRATHAIFDDLPVRALQGEKSVGPRRKDDDEAGGDCERRMEPRGEDGDEIAGETRGLGEGGHAANEVRAERRTAVRFEICKPNDDSRSHDRRNKVQEERDGEPVLPEEVEGDDGEAGVGRQLRGMHLVEENLFSQGHAGEG
jgi:hypothetical protein